MTPGQREVSAPEPQPVKVESGDPRYCQQPVRHEPHIYRYEYDAPDGHRLGSYECDGDASGVVSSSSTLRDAEDYASSLRADLDRAQAALQAVRAIHSPDRMGVCMGGHLGAPRWPCPTVTAINPRPPKKPVPPPPGPPPKGGGGASPPIRIGLLRDQPAAREEMLRGRLDQIWGWAKAGERTDREGGKYYLMAVENVDGFTDAVLAIIQREEMT